MTSNDKFCDGIYPYKKKLKTKKFERQKQQLQVELLKAQRWAKQTDQRVVAVFEGRDAAGKGGTIKRFMEHLNPRRARVVALEKPTNREMHQWYFQRYVRHLPTAGEFTFFDRSWYNRAGVERVMGFCTDTQYHEFLRQAPEFESMLVNSGITFIKFWFAVTQEEQMRRIEARENDPLKQWKVSPIDIAAKTQWDEYTEARDIMLRHTNTAENPWTLIKSDGKKRARLNCMRYFLSQLDYPDKDTDIVTAPDPLIVTNPPPAATWDLPTA